MSGEDGAGEVFARIMRKVDGKPTDAEAGDMYTAAAVASATARVRLARAQRELNAAQADYRRLADEEEKALKLVLGEKDPMQVLREARRRP